MTLTTVNLRAAADRLAHAADDWNTVTGAGWMGPDGDPYDEPGARPCAFVLFTRTEGDLAVAVSLNLTEPEDRAFDRERAYTGKSGDHCLANFPAVRAEGHTGYNGRTFTRRGIDVSSNGLSSSAAHLYPHEYPDVPSLLAGEWERCRAAHARSQTAVPVPGLPFSVQPDWFERSGALLRAGKTVTLTPSGFGTGYALSTRRQFRHDRRETGELAQRLGVPAVYVQTLDCD